MGKESGTDEDFDSLSSDEKNAFEKIMAEIASVNGSDTVTPVRNPIGGSSKDAPDTQKTDGDDASSLNHNPGGANSAEKPGDTDEPTDTDELTTDQQAALDKIMAEISGTADSSSEPKTPAETQSNASAEDELTEDQQAALDKIMAEISGQPPSSDETAQTPEPLSAAKDQTEEALTEEQQSALANILSEIDSKKNKPLEPPKQARTQTPVEQSATLSDDQQAALDKIMSEIDSKRGKEIMSEAEPRVDEKDEEGVLSDDQNDALKKIMAEIEARKKNPDAEETDPGTDVKEEPSPPQKNEAINLSLDEFNKELNALLSGENKDADDKDGPLKAKDKVENVEQSLKNLLGETKDQQNASPSETEQPARQAKAPLSPERQVKSEPSYTKYVILQEVDPIEQETPQPARSSENSKKLKKQSGPGNRLKKTFAWMIAITGALGLFAGVAYWRHQQKNQSVSQFAVDKIAVTSEESDMTKEASPQEKPAPVVAPSPQSPEQKVAEARPEPQIAPLAEQPAVPTPSLQALTHEIDIARNKILLKIREILELKIYYQQGIDDEAAHVADMVSQNRVTTLQQALRNNKIELALRSIQRRANYIKKLDTPLVELTSASEELLFLKRRSELYALLQDRISSFSVEPFIHEADRILKSRLESVALLSIDKVSATAPSFEQAWVIVAEKMKKNITVQLRKTDSTSRDHTVSEEICNGRFERMYLLTALSSETANCLLRWKGKDLYLNELRQLPPDIAQLLSQWPGEWLSLNGLKELSDDAAGFLSQWPGKRLSLNGLTALSPQATAHLSAWRGEQLELVGLESIGRWENYGTRLFLSEKLKRRLEDR